MGINQSCPVLFSAHRQKQVCWSHLRVSILQTRGLRNPPDNCGTPPADLPPQAAKFKRRYRKCAGINRHVVGNERVLQERRERIHLGLESCGGHRKVPVEA